MLVQSGGGKVYAILAQNPSFELGVMPTLHIVSTTVFIGVRCRFKSLMSEYFDPMLAPKQILVAGIERSENTLRGTVMLNTGFTLDKVGAGFAEIVAKKLFAAADGFLLGHPGDSTVALYSTDKRKDFVQDFAQLVTSAVAPIFPAKDFTGAGPLLNAFDLGLFQMKAVAPPSPFAAIPGGKAIDAGVPVTKLPIGGDDEPVPPAPEEVVDKPAAAAEVSAKVHILGQAPAPRQSDQQPVPEADPAY